MSIQNKIVERILAGVGGGGQPLIETDAELRTITGEKPRDLAGRYMEYVRHYFNDIANQTSCENNGIIYESEINIPSMQELFKNVVYAHSPDKLYYFNANHLGSGSLITDKYGQTYQTLIYAPHGEVLYNKFYGDYDEPYKFNGKELDSETGFYNFNARQQDPIKDIWTSTDPMWYKYPNKSPYVVMGNNPVNAIDPDGRSTYVLNNDDGTYRVVGGNLDDKDLNIYLFSAGKNGELVKTSIGQTTSMTSFYDSDNSQWRGTINPNDNSGKEFLDNFVKDNPEIGYYMDNAKGGQKYDFKRTNGTDKVLYTDNDSYYRGMPVQTQKDGTKVYTSARDVGNIAAGYIAGLYGVPWDMARKQFDALESQQKGYPTVEGISSQNAQRVGWNTGMRDGTNNPYVRFFNWLNSIPTGIKLLFK